MRLISDGGGDEILEGIPDAFQALVLEARFPQASSLHLQAKIFLLVPCTFKLGFHKLQPEKSRPLLNNPLSKIIYSSNLPHFLQVIQKRATLWN